MMRASFLALMISASCAAAQDYVAGYTPADPDDLDIRASSEGHFAEIHYDNAASLTSQSGTHVLMWEGEAFTVDITVGGHEVNGAEILRVTPPDHLIAVPDYAEVPDGDVFIVQIMRPMF